MAWTIPALLLLTASLVLGDDSECNIPPCGRIENYYPAYFHACFGTTQAAITAAGFPDSLCPIWNNNGILDGGGGPDPNQGKVPCLCWVLGPSAALTGVGGWSERRDVDWFTFHTIDYTVEWDRLIVSHPPRSVPASQYTKINSGETAVCIGVAGKPHCKITLG
ncbi:hypothetical protein DL98DRAFT_518336 [Cadophora sp. DSE1049]|nr:hypothetical protein DL98DRAFT_518336 [Cadophora sp. DSE1049]